MTIADTRVSHIGTTSILIGACLVGRAVQVVMASHPYGAPLLFLLQFTLFCGVLGSPRSYFDITPNINEEVSDLLAALLEEDDGPQQQQHQSDGGWPHAVEVPGWSRSSPHLGQVSGVAIDQEGRPVIFHRGPVSWLLSSFNNSHHYQLANQGPIPVDTILTLHPASGAVLEGWGRNKFYLPHGIAICPRTGDTWLTDVALHQVFKFRGGKTDVPEVVIGQKFEPGSDANHFCKPTSVAIARAGDVFVSDGYCNQRVLHFTAEGRLIAELGRELGSMTMTLPHGVALIEERDVACVADREAKRIVCMHAGIHEPDRAGQLIGSFQDSRVGPIFDIDVAGGVLFAVSGSSESVPATGFTLDPSTGNIVDTWAPRGGFHAPHAIAVTPDGTTIYVGEIGPNRLTKFAITL